MTQPYWLQHCPPPRSRPADVDWDVFISYRSINRPWALALYDMLQQAGYKTFLDQYVLVAGQGLASQLGRNLERSGSGVVLWSKHTEDSTWVEHEYDMMFSRHAETKKSAYPFHFLLARLDAELPPGLFGGALHLDFSSYPDGPTGAELVRLMFGLRGEPLDHPAVARIAAAEQSIREEPKSLRALTATGDFDAIARRAMRDDPAYMTSANVPSLAAELLIRGKRYSEALQVIEHAQTRFRASIRLRQLFGLALRRSGKLDEAILALEMLRADGHQDPETLGMLAAAWADRSERAQAANESRRARDALERSRDLYALAFELTPTDTYVGINAASKSALLGETPRAQELASRVLNRLELAKNARGGSEPDDYWLRVTEPEALLLLGKHEQALKLYHAARIAHQTELGSIESTATQVKRLLRVLPVPAEEAAKLEQEFA